MDRIMAVLNEIGTYLTNTNSAFFYILLTIYLLYIMITVFYRVRQWSIHKHKRLIKLNLAVPKWPSVNAFILKSYFREDLILQRYN